MAQVSTTSVARQIESLFDGGSVAGFSDRQLLERFVARRDQAAEAAFAALVARHGPMVLHVCRQLLGDRHHAEDAFQAVFLVLARKAGSIRDPDLLGNWLYGVALRTARKARVRHARLRKGEGDGSMRHSSLVTDVPADRSAIDREQAEALHAEIGRLPGSFRLPLVLCYFEGLSLDEAARRLRCPPGTVHSRLVRARDRLRRGLTRRGVVLPAATLATALTPQTASASISSPLCDITTRAAMNFAAGHAAAGATSASVTALAREVLRSMILYKLKLIGMTLIFLGALSTGAGYWNHTLATQEEPRKPPAGPQTRIAAAPDDAPQRPAPGRMFVVGRVLDPQGKPVQGAVVDVVTRFRSPQIGAVDESKPWLTLLGQGRSDEAGRFRLDAPRTAAGRVFRVNAMAAAPGYGLGWAELDPDASQPEAEIRLFPEQAVHVRLVDVTGGPARFVDVRVLMIGRQTPEGLFDGVSISGIPPEGIRTWPRPVTTDEQGRITLSGIGRDLGVTLDVRDLRYARQDLRVAPAGVAGRQITFALQPARLIEGRVIAADTGQPIPGAVVSIGAGRNRFGGLGLTRFPADDRGRFAANPSPGDYFSMSAYTPEGQPYLVPRLEFAWAKAAVRKELDIPIPRGVLIRGRVTESRKNRPLPDSTIYFIPVGGSVGVLSGWEAIVASRDEGSFQIAVPPGKGHLLVFGPTGDYVPVEIGLNKLDNDRPGGWRYRVHAVIPYQVKAGEPPLEVAAALRPGVTIKGRVEGPDGQKVTDAFILTTLRVEATRPSWSGADRVKVRDGRFELHGLDPEGSSRISILDPEHEWGATIAVSGKRAREELSIRLQPCGKARARFVGTNGRPVARPDATFQFVATPGPSQYSRRTHREQDKLTADADFLANIDRKHYWDDPRIDSEGRMTLVSLIPGALYRILDFSTANMEKGAQVRKDFTVKPGETLDLGDILIEKPQAQ